jgi:hypothetical protein
MHAETLVFTRTSIPTLGIEFGSYWRTLRQCRAWFLG